MKRGQGVVQGRYYLHGDEREGHPGTFYCLSCDVFYDIEHFTQPPLFKSRGETHLQVYEHHLRNLRAMRKYVVKSRPPMPSNCIVGPGLLASNITVLAPAQAQRAAAQGAAL